MTPDEAQPVIEAACLAGCVDVDQITDAKAIHDPAVKATRAAIVEELAAAGLSFRQIGAIVQRHHKTLLGTRSAETRINSPATYEAAARAARAEIRRHFAGKQPEPVFRSVKHEPGLRWIVRDGELRLAGPPKRLAAIRERNQRAAEQASFHTASMENA